MSRVDRLGSQSLCGKLQRHVKASIKLELGRMREEYQRKLPSTLGEIYLFRMAPKPNSHGKTVPYFLVVISIKLQ